MKSLEIIAQPKASFRERYLSEIKQKGPPIQRFIRADENSPGFDYPTINVSIQSPHSISLEMIPIELFLILLYIFSH
jgi:hypothetical protein